MPPDRVVIDLLSSPEVVLPKARPSTTLPSKVLSYNALKVTQGKEEWLVLSFDDDVVPASSIGVLPAAKSPRTKEAISATSVFAKPGWDFGGIDGDFGEPIAKSTNGENIKPSAFSKATESKNTGRGGSSTKTIKGANDFCFLEDDFDSTVNFDDSYVQSELPPAKKRRTSESPKSKPMPLASNNGGNNATKSKPRDSGAGYKRSISNIEGSSKAKISGMSGRTTSAPGLKRANTFATVQEDDPILFTSSPDPVLDAARRRREKAKKNKEVKTDVFGFTPSSEDDEIQVKKATSKSIGRPQASLLGLQELSEDSDDFLDVDAPRKNDKGNALPKQVTKPNMKTSGFYELEDSSDVEVSKPKLKTSAIDDSSDIELPDINGIKTKSKPKPKVRSTEEILAKYAATKAKEKAASEKEKAAKAKSEAAAAKKAAKEAEKEEKQRAKEKKAKDKQTEKELAAVNQLRTDKKLSTPEMIVDLPSCLENKLESQIHAFLDDVKVEYIEYSCIQPIVKWRRKVNAEYDEEKDHWVPVNPYIKNEQHIMYVLSAKDFISLVQGDEGHDINALMLHLRAKFPDYQIIFLMEGYGPWLRKNKGIKDKQFKEAVHSHVGPLVPGQNMYPSSSQTAKARKKAGAGEYIAEEKIEEALLKLQIEHDVYIHHTNVMQETAQWVKVFTENISSVPYKKQNLSANFCMETGQIKTGEDAQDTFIKMLQEIIRVTAPVAVGIVHEYPTVQDLVQGFEDKGPLALENLKQSANRNGALAERRLGPAISRKVYSVFMGSDPAALIND